MTIHFMTMWSLTAANGDTGSLIEKHGFILRCCAGLSAVGAI
jgi:hypothetical protein